MTTYQQLNAYWSRRLAREVHEAEAEIRQLLKEGCCYNPSSAAMTRPMTREARRLVIATVLRRVGEQTQ